MVSVLFPCLRVRVDRGLHDEAASQAATGFSNSCMLAMSSNGLTGGVQSRIMKLPQPRRSPGDLSAPDPLALQQLP